MLLQLKYNKTLNSNHILLPLSKSIANRQQIINFLSGEALQAFSNARDSILLNECLNQLQKDSNTTLYCENAGTVIRFLTALCCLIPDEQLLNCNDRMKSRPIADLVNPLLELGADIEYPEKDDYPPLLIKSSKLKAKNIQLDINKSSQFLTAILLIAPYLDKELNIEVKGTHSWSYVKMTLELMKQNGAQLQYRDNHIKISPSKYKITNKLPESDWSSAAFWYELFCLSDLEEMIIPGLSLNSLQGDAVLVDIFKNLGIETVGVTDGIELKKSRRKTESFDFDFSNCPDLAPAVIVCCAALGITSIFTGLKNLKIKESDRTLALQTELAKVGIALKEISKDRFEIEGKHSLSMPDKEIVLDAWDDHRIAMALAPLVVKTQELNIDNAECIKKSYPEFWNQLKNSGINLQEA